MEVPFPRGDSKSNEIHSESKGSTKRSFLASKEALFGNNKRVKRVEIVQKKKDKVTNRRIKVAPASADVPSIGLGLLKVSTIHNKLMKIDNWKRTHFSVGVLVMGYVLEVLETKLTISLPGSYIGVVEYPEISDTLWRLLNQPNTSVDQLPLTNNLIQPLQFVRCVVLKSSDENESRKGLIKLSMRAFMINKGVTLKHLMNGFPMYGCVASIEDHGYLIDCGIPSTNCFLPQSAIPNKASSLIEGQPIECICSDINEESRTITLKSQQKLVQQSVIRGGALTFNSLVVGMMMNVTVEKFLENGITVRFLNIFHGVIDLNSLPYLYSPKEWKLVSVNEGPNSIHVGDLFPARIIFLDHVGKSVRLSSKSHVLHMRAPRYWPHIGEMIENLEVKQVNKKAGIHLICPNTSMELNDELDKDAEESAVPENETVKKSKKLARQAADRKKLIESEHNLTVCIKTHSLSGHPNFTASKDFDNKTDEENNLDSENIDTSSHEMKPPMEIEVIGDDKVDPEKIIKVYRPGQVISVARVTGYSVVEGWIMASNIENVIQGQVRHISDIRVGQIHSVKVLQVKSYGLDVIIADKVHAICPLFHLSDSLESFKKDTKKKACAEKNYKMRVWEVIGKSVIMTQKKALLKLPDSELHLLAEAIEPRTKLIGIISKCNANHGITVRFFNKIIGMIPMPILMKQGVLDPVEAYNVGQIIRTIVVKVNTFSNRNRQQQRDDDAGEDFGNENKMIEETSLFSSRTNSNPNTHYRLILGLDIGNVDDIISLDHSHAADENVPSANVERVVHPSGIEFVSGTIYKIMKVHERDIVYYDQNAAESKDNMETWVAYVRLDNGRTGFIGQSHFFDFAVTAERLLNSTGCEIKSGYRINEALVLNFTNQEEATNPTDDKAKKHSSPYKPNVVYLTLKPLLLSVAKAQLKITSESLTTSSSELPSIPCNLSELSPGQIAVGYISKVEPFGVFVRFRHGLTALAHRPNIADKFINSPIGLFTPGDSIQCVIQRVDVVTERIMVTFKPSLVPPSVGEICYLPNLFYETFQSMKAITGSTKKILPDWNKYPLNSITTATVSSIEEYGVILMAEDHVTMMLAKNISAVETKDLIEIQKKNGKNNLIKVRALDIDYTSGVLDVSIEKAHTLTKKKKSESEHEVLATKAYNASIVLIREHYLVVFVQDSIQRIGYVSIADYNNPKPDLTEYAVHQIIQVKLLESSFEASGRNLFPHSNQLFLSLFHDQGANHRAQVRLMQQEAKESDIQMQLRMERRLNQASNPSSEKLDQEQRNVFAVGLADIKAGNNGTAAALSVIEEQQKLKDTLRVGYFTKWIVQEIKDHEVILTPDSAFQFNETSGLKVNASIHLTGAVSVEYVPKLVRLVESAKLTKENAINQKNSEGVELFRFHPFSKLSMGRKIWCKVLQVRKKHPNSEGSEGKTDEKVKETIPYDEYTVLLSLSRRPRKKRSTSIAQSDDGDAEEADDHPVPEAATKSHPPLLHMYGNAEVKCPTIHVGVVTAIHELHCTIAFSPYVSAVLPYVDVSHDINLVNEFIKFCTIGMQLIVAVTSIQKDPTGKFIRKMTLSRRVIESIIDSSDDFSKIFEITTTDLAAKMNQSSSIQVGDQVWGQINLKNSRVPKLPAVAINLENGKLGRICVTELEDYDSWKDLVPLFESRKGETENEDDHVTSRELPNGHKHGELINCRVVVISDAIIELSLRSSSQMLEELTPSEGQVVKAYVVNTSSKGCFLRLNRNWTGLVQLKNLADEYIENPSKTFPMGKLVNAKILEVDHAEGFVRLSMKSSVVTGNAALMKALDLIKPGDIVKGTVISVKENIGVFVTIQDSPLVGLARASCCLDSKKSQSSKSLKDLYEIGDLVRAIVLNVSRSSMKVGLGLHDRYFKKGYRLTNDVATDGNDVENEEEGEENVIEMVPELADEVKDSIKDGKVDDQDESGADSDDDEVVVNGQLMQKSLGKDHKRKLEIDGEVPAVPSHSRDNNKKEVKQKNKKVKSIGKLSQGIVDPAEIENETESDRHAVEVHAKVEGDSDSEGSIEPPVNIFSAGGKGVRDLFLEWDDFQLSKKKTADVDDKADELSSSDENDEDMEDGSKPKKMNSKQKSRKKETAKKLQEEAIRARENALMDGSLVPESTLDFDRMLLAEPNSSYLWIQYMAFHLRKVDIEAARLVAAKALRTINYRDEEEKFNVWVAMLNMEHKFGSNETLNEVFERAISESKAKYLYLKLAEIYNKSGDAVGAEEVYQRALKKIQFKKSKKVWNEYLGFKIQIGDEKGAKEQLARSMQSLSRHKHVEVISKFAMNEFEFGSKDRGRVLFEELLHSYPKRTDLWHLYLDKEMKLGNHLQCRQLFERMIMMKTNTKNMKTIFKKYLDFEMKNGTVESQELVKQKAREYVNRVAKK